MGTARPLGRGLHDTRAHTLGEPHGVHLAAHGKPVALKMQREIVAPQEMGRGVTPKPWSVLLIGPTSPGTLDQRERQQDDSW